MKAILSDRLLLREVVPADATPEYLSWLRDPLINQYLEVRHQTVTMDGLIDYISSKRKNSNALFLAIIFSKTKKMIGTIKLEPISWTQKCSELGIMTGNKAYWGKGLASEAICSVSKYAFENLGLDKITAGFYINHGQSASAFYKSGFKREEIIKDSILYKGKLIDSDRVVLLNPNSAQI